MALRFKVTGINTTIAFLAAKQLKLQNQIQKGLNESALLVTKEVKESIAGRKAEKRSVNTGQFLNSVNFNVTKDNASIFSNVPQAIFMEFGTRKITERRHFRNSLSRSRSKIQEILKKSISIL